MQVCAHSTDKWEISLAFQETRILKIGPYLAEIGIYNDFEKFPKKVTFGKSLAPNSTFNIINGPLSIKKNIWYLERLLKALFSMCRFHFGD